MNYKTLGKTGIKVSEVCLGTGEYGIEVEPQKAIKIIQAAYESGINFFDTANAYANGHSEETLGKAIKSFRQNVTVTTKVGLNVGPGPNDKGGSRKHIMKAVEDSLRRLQTDYIDIYCAHTPDPDTPIEVTLRAFDDLVQQGKVRYAGASNIKAWQLCKALWMSDHYNLAPFYFVQPPYNLLTRDIETELLPLCASENLAVCVYNPLAGGFLTGKYDPKKKPPTDLRFGLERFGEMYRDRYWYNSNFEAITKLKKVADKHGHNLAQFSLAWILNNNNITAPIFTVTSIEQLKANMAATELKLSKEELTVCDEVWAQFRPPRYPYWR